MDGRLPGTGGRNPAGGVWVVEVDLQTTSLGWGRVELRRKVPEPTRRLG